MNTPVYREMVRSYARKNRRTKQEQNQTSLNYVLQEAVENVSTDYERSALPLRSSKNATPKGCFQTWKSKLTV